LFVEHISPAEKRDITCCKNDLFSKMKTTKCVVNSPWMTGCEPTLLSGKMILFRGIRKTRTNPLPTPKPHFFPFGLKPPEVAFFGKKEKMNLEEEKKHKPFESL
jgi:hypothetical protein